jgi:hypothetical protein
LGNSLPIKSDYSSVHANYAWLRRKGLDALILPASRCPVRLTLTAEASSAYFVEAEDSREHVE